MTHLPSLALKAPMEQEAAVSRPLADIDTRTKPGDNAMATFFGGIRSKTYICKKETYVQDV